VKSSSLSPAARRVLLIAAIAGVLLLLPSIVLLLRVHPRAGLTIHEVLAGAVYGAAQPSAADLADVARHAGIRTVINLRGSRASEPWYQEEIAACRKLGLRHADVRIKLDDDVPENEVHRLVDLLDHAPRPLLLHCKDGVDRTGWGAAVALCLAGEPLEQALAPLSLTAGHIGTAATSPLDRFFAQYRAWLRDNRLQHSAATFRRWALQEYCPVPYNAALVLLKWPDPPRVPAGRLLTFMVRATNRSPEAWALSDREDRGIRLGVRILGPLAEPLADPVAVFRTPGGPARDAARAGVETGTIGPGESRSFSVVFAAPRQPGQYVLQFDMVDERVHWFSDLGGPGIILALDVLPTNE
jgi:protein tyrosine phosphatase (PTP) superfamily phosphohydrolase (DUF442 family)